MAGHLQGLELVLYGRANCCLCDRLESLITPHLQAQRGNGNVTLTKRNIDDDAHWQDLYGTRIPVLTHGAKVVLEGRPEPEAVAAAFAELSDC